MGKGAIPTGIDAVATKSAAAAFKIELGITAWTGDNYLSGAGADASVTLGAGVDEGSRLDRPGGGRRGGGGSLKFPLNRAERVTSLFVVDLRSENTTPTFKRTIHSRIVLRFGSTI